MGGHCHPRQYRGLARSTPPSRYNELRKEPAAASNPQANITGTRTMSIWAVLLGRKNSARELPNISWRSRRCESAAYRLCLCRRVRLHQRPRFKLQRKVASSSTKILPGDPPASCASCASAMRSSSKRRPTFGRMTPSSIAALRLIIAISWARFGMM
jgi:hypothetical protein